MVFHQRNRNPYTDELGIIVDDQRIERVSNTKFLGVMIDDKLNWKSHIDYIATKLSKIIGIFVKVRQYLPKYALRTLYYTFVYPYLMYCNIHWASNYPTNLTSLEILQKKIVRIITFSPPSSHTAPLFKNLKLLQFENLHEYLICIFMYKYTMDMLPVVFEGWFTLRSSIHRYNTRQSDSYHLHKFRTNIGKFSLRSQGTKVWNSVPLQMRTANNLRQFKGLLKHYLLSKQSE